jgi:Tfp pilus assembly protein PilP
MIKNIFFCIIFLITIFSNVAFAEGDPFTKRLTRDSISNSMDDNAKEPAIFKKKINNEFNSSVSNENLEKYILKATALASKGKDANSSNKNDQNSIINSNNMAIVAVGNKEIMVRQGDKLGSKNGVIISIEKNKMTVVEDNKEFIFEINTPLKKTSNVR